MSGDTMTVCAAPPRAGAPGRVTAVLTNVAATAWNAFADVHGTVYHQWEWQRVFEDAFGHECVYLAAADDQQIVGILPLVIIRPPLGHAYAVSLPFVDGGGVRVRSEDAAARLLTEASALMDARGLSHIELRHEEAQFRGLPVRQHKVDMRLPLPASAAGAWEALDRKIRNQVRKAEKSGLTVRQGGAELVDAFYRVFAHNMRDLGTPVYSPRLFAAVCEAWRERARITVVDYDGRVIAAAVSLQHRDVLTVPWASALRQYRTLCANVLLYWRLVEMAIEKGCGVFDFGRSTPGAGTYHFKAQWGATPVPLHWEYVVRGQATVPHLSPANPRFRLAIAAWKRLPVPLASWLGPRVVKYLP
jgi:FemAB-related protein (PEP-CTERM system-associated)